MKALLPFALLLTLTAPLAAVPLAGKATRYLMYVGTFTRGKSKGIYVWRFDAVKGKASSLGVAAELTNPSWLTIHPNGNYLYAVSEVDDYQGNGGAVAAYNIDRLTGKLAKINMVPSRGKGPCHIELDHASNMLYSANYAGGSVTAFPIKIDGSLGESSQYQQHTGSSVNKERQSAPHAHSVNISPDNRLVLVPDLGLDEVLAYKLDLTPNDPPFTKIKPGSGPRHMVFASNGKFAYVLGEMGSNVTVFSYDAKTGKMAELQEISTLAPDFKGSSSGAEVAIHPNGRFLYTSNRGADSIAVFAIDKSKGTLTAVDNIPTGGKTPRSFAIDPTGTWFLAANQDSDNITLFQIDKRSGKLRPTGQSIAAASPVCIQFVRSK